MANVTDSASLLTIPSGWDDGVLGSLKPDDGTGDFTFSRGADLSATRVNEDGYIEKGYENLLLQSNSFDSAAWILKPGATLTSGIADPDGGTNAWQLNFDGTANARIEQQVTVTSNSVYTFSFYGRVSSGTKDISVGATGQLTTKTLTTEWQRIELFGVTTTTITFPQIRTKDTSVYSIEIYQAQFNQGLAARPYIETTTTTAKSTTILEDQPRIDYTNGTNGNILVEPQRTNIVPTLLFMAFNGATYNISSTEIGGGMPMQHFTKTAISHYAGHIITGQSISIGDVYAFSMFFKPISAENNFHKIAMSIHLQDDPFYYDYSREGFFNDRSGTPLPSNKYVEEYANGVYRLVHIQTSTVSQNRLNINIDGYYNNTSEFLCGYAQIEKENTISSYIPTYGTSTTRLKETATLTKNVASTGTIYINIEAQKSRTLTFLGANISVTAGTNKIAMSYSPTALKVSHNGSIVANTARTFDTASLTQIQLGHRNNFEQTTDGINQFLTLDSFLSDADLNALTI